MGKFAEARQHYKIALDLDGKRLWYGTHDGEARLARVEPLAGRNKRLVAAVEGFLGSN